MSERPDLASVRKIAALELEAQSRDVMLALCDYAARLEREAEGLRQEYMDYQEHTAVSHQIMVDEVAALEQAAEGLRAGLERYGMHTSTCPVRIKYGGKSGKCRCGITALLAAAP